MESTACDVCSTVFSAETCYLKVLECGHALCVKCLKKVLRIQKNCHTCTKTLLKSMDEHPTNLDHFLKNNTSLKEKCGPDHREINSLTDKVNLQLSTKEKIKNSIEEKLSSFKSELLISTEQKYSYLKNELVTLNNKIFSYLTDELAITSEESISSFKKEITDRVEKFKKLLHEEIEFSDVAEQKEESDCHSEVQKRNRCSCSRNERIMLQSDQYKNKNHFLYDLVVRLQNDEKIYTCELIGDDGWRYGKITFSENRIHIHCLSSATNGNDVFIVSYYDVRNCIRSVEDISLFIRIGNQKLIFNLTEDFTPETHNIIKLFTGEGGQTLKGIKVIVDKFYEGTNIKSNTNSSDTLELNRCEISLPNSTNEMDLEEILSKSTLYKMNKDDVILQNSNDIVCIYKVPEMTPSTFYNVVAKLHKDFQIDFDELLNNMVEDSGICFSV